MNPLPNRFTIRDLPRHVLDRLDSKKPIQSAIDAYGVKDWTNHDPCVVMTLTDADQGIESCQFAVGMIVGVEEGYAWAGSVDDSEPVLFSEVLAWRCQDSPNTVLLSADLLRDSEECLAKAWNDYFAALNNAARADLYREALSLWGHDAIVGMFVGECHELGAEIVRKYIQGRDNPDALLDEVVDVSILCEQLEHAWGLDEQRASVSLSGSFTIRLCFLSKAIKGATDILIMPQSAGSQSAKADIIQAAKFAAGSTVDPSNSNLRNRILSKLKKLQKKVENAKSGLVSCPNVDHSLE